MVITLNKGGQTRVRKSDSGKFDGKWGIKWELGLERAVQFVCTKLMYCTFACSTVSRKRKGGFWGVAHGTSRIIRGYLKLKLCWMPILKVRIN